MAATDSLELAERRFVQLDVNGTSTVSTPDAMMSGSMMALAITLGWTADRITTTSSREDVVAHLDGPAYRRHGLLFVLSTSTRTEPSTTRLRVEPRGWRTTFLTSGLSDPEGQITLHNVHPPQDQIVTDNPSPT